MSDAGKAVADVLAERGSNYGNFFEHASIVRDFKNVVDRAAFYRMQPDAQQAMCVIFDKFARMLNGNPEYDDNWRDIAGYATLVLQRIEREAKDPKETKPRSPLVTRSSLSTEGNSSQTPPATW